MKRPCITKATGRIVAMLAVTLLASSAAADHAVWEFRKYQYKVNANSFANNLNGHSLTTDQAIFWVNYAASTWYTRTGANASAFYAGTTSLDCYDLSNTSWNKDGTNVVSAVDGCKGGTSSCDSWATAKLWRTGLFGTGPYIDEADVCIWNAASGSKADDWDTQLAYIDGDEGDLVHVLIHEIGHAFGMHHPDDFDPAGPSDVLMGPNIGIGDNRGRVQFGWDLDQMRDLYGTKTHQRHWRSCSNGSCSSYVYPFAGNKNWQKTAGTIAGVSSNTNRYVITSTVSPSGDVKFHRAQYPLSSSSSWSSATFTFQDTWRTPGLAANSSVGSGALAVAAWPTQYYDEGYNCGLVTLVSSNGFTSGIDNTFWNADYCSMLSPAVSYDRSSGRFILIWVRHKDSLGKGAGRVFAMTSLDGENWTSPQDLGFWTTTAPGLACNWGECLLTHTKGASKEPSLMARRITVASNGDISLHSLNSKSVRVQYSPDAGIYYDGGYDWLSTYHFDSATGDANGEGRWRIHRDDSNPPDLNVWSAWDSTYFPAAIASKPFLGTHYMLFHDM